MTLTPQQHQARARGLGGSDIAAVLGLSRYRTPYEVWLEKTGQAVQESGESEPAYWGQVLEDVTAREYSKRTDWQSLAKHLGADDSLISQFTTEKPGSRRLFKYLPVSVELARAVTLDEAAERGEQGSVIDADCVVEPEAEAKLAEIQNEQPE